MCNVFIKNDDMLLIFIIVNASVFFVKKTFLLDFGTKVAFNGT